MHTIAKLITGHRKIIMVVFGILSLLGVVLMTQVDVNYDMLDYLPADAESTIALEVMWEEFEGNVPNVRAMIRDVDLVEALQIKEDILQIEGVTDVMWLDDVVDIKAPIEMADTETVEAYYKDRAALFSVTVENGMEARAIDALYDLLGDGSAIAGDAASTAFSQNMAASESLGAMAILIPLVIVILLLTSSAWAEPVLFLLTIGGSVLINLGTNIFLGEISYITQAISPILQMAVSLDYAIFLLHSFEEHRMRTSDMEVAMQKAIQESFPAIAASAATTLFGFLALMFMQFRIGPDLGLNLVKGVILSYLSVMVFLPAVTLTCHKWLDKTRHKKILPSFEKAGKFLLKIRIPGLVMVLLVLIPCFLAQQRTNFIYGIGEPDPSTRLGQDTAAVEEVFGKSTTLVLMVPKGDVARELALCNDLKKVDHITNVMSYTTTVGSTIPPDYLDESITGNFYSENLARIILTSSNPQEGEEAFATVEAVRETVGAYYDTYYSCGQSANLYDMKTVVSSDTGLVNIIAVIAIILVLLCTFKSLSIPIILVFVIETAIWINLSIPYFAGNSLSYIGYLVINTVQLGATIDYAILLTESYMRNRQTHVKRAAMEKTIGNNFVSIATSALILASAGLCLALTSSNSIVTEMGVLLGRGTIFSILLVCAVLPCLLLIFDPVIEKTTLRPKFYKELSK